MKKTLINIGLAATLLATGCTKNFDQINTDPTQASAATYDPNLLLPTAELGYLNAVTGYSGPVLFQSMWVQTFASALYPSYYSNGDKYVASSNILSYDASTWNDAYSAASSAYEAQSLSKGNSKYTNLSGICLIVELLNIQAVTDTYGDCPYSQALQAKAGISYPAYDAQQTIYASMLTKLDSVLSTLDASLATPTNDALPYKGSIAQWKKFGYSLMLKMAMRLTKVDAATAQTYAEKAYAGGTFASNADNAYIAYDQADGYTNNNVNALAVAEDYAEVKWGAQLISYLKSTNDPRLSIIAEVPKTGLANASNEALAGDNASADQVGMPSGYDENGGATDISKSPNYPGASAADPSIANDQANPTGKYSRPTTALYMPLPTPKNTPSFILTYAQTEFLLAEAAVRGWNVGATASVHYANGISAGLQTYSTFSSTGTISAAVATAYAASNPLDVSSTDNSLKQINTEYWVLEGTIFDFSEAWSNWRRSGYPVLTPVNYAGNFTGATIPRREAYPSGEASTNPAGYKTGVSSLSTGDTYTGRVWWDK